MTIGHGEWQVDTIKQYYTQYTVVTGFKKIIQGHNNRLEGSTLGMNIIERTNERKIKTGQEYHVVSCH